MARTKDAAGAARPKGRIAQLRAVFAMTRQSDPFAAWLMLLAFVGAVALGLLIGLLTGHPIYVTIISLPVGIVLAMLILARRAERAAYAQLAGQTGATGSALGSLRRGWNVEQEPVQVDPRTRDMVFRAIGRPGVVLVTEGPQHRVRKLAEAERKRVLRVVPNVPVTVVNAGDEEGQVPLRKLPRTVMRMRPALSKTEVSEVAKRLHAVGRNRLPVPKGVDPFKARPDRKATRGR